MSRKKLAPRAFKVVFEPDGTGWHATIPEVQGCLTWGRSISEAERNIREALATCEDVLGADAEQIASNANFEREWKVSSHARKALNSFAEILKRQKRSRAAG